MNFTKTFGSFRTFGSSAKRFSGAGEHPTDGSSFKMWRYATYFFCVPVVTATTYMNFGPNAEHGHRPTYVPYDYLRIRTKALNFKLIGCRPIFPILLPPPLFVVFLLSKFRHFWPPSLPLRGDIVYGWPLIQKLEFEQTKPIKYILFICKMIAHLVLLNLSYK